MRIERVAVLVLSLVLIFGVTTSCLAQDASSSSSQAPAAQQPSTPPPPAPSAAAAESKPAPKLTDYSRRRSHIPDPIAPYISRPVVPAFLGNSPRIDQLLQNGKIMLSLDDAIALALENNLDLAIARYNLSIADTDILRAKAGQSTRGVNTGVVEQSMVALAPASPITGAVVSRTVMVWLLVPDALPQASTAFQVLVRV